MGLGDRGNASSHNLQGVTVHFPIGLLTCVTGVSSSGQSTLVNEHCTQRWPKRLYRIQPAEHEEIRGLEHFDKVINVDQSPGGRTRAATPPTGLFRRHPQADGRHQHRQRRGYGPGASSINVSRAAGGGR